MSGFVSLMYHNVVPAAELSGPDGPFAHLSPSITSYFVTSDQFRSHLAEVPRHRWIDPAELRADPLWNNPSDPPQILLTFDDGWAGSIDEAAPVLRDHGARALLFVTTGLIGRPLFASAAQLQAVGDAFEIGSHTVTHPFLNELDESSIRKELAESRFRLEDLLGREVDTISIPNGALDDRVRRIAADVGYRFLFTSEIHANSAATGRRNIGRVAVRHDTSRETIRRWSSGELGAAGQRRAALAWPKRLLGPARYRRLRAWALGERTSHNDMQALVHVQSQAANLP